MKIFTTGIGSGIGRFIHEELGGDGLSRERAADCIHQARLEGVDVLIHCAFNSTKNVAANSLYDYYSDNVLLTKELLAIPHKKFIYFSTVDIYPKNNEVHTEKEIPDLDEVSGIYGITKLISESLVQRESGNFLVLRPTALLGRYMRVNTLIRMINGDSSCLFLSGDSCVNYVLYSDILAFIHFAIQHDVKGIYNLASTANATLLEVASFLERNIEFGQHVYDVGKIANAKLDEVFPAFFKTSIRALQEFLEERHE